MSGQTLSSLLPLFYIVSVDLSLLLRKIKSLCSTLVFDLVHSLVRFDTGQTVEKVCTSWLTGRLQAAYRQMNFMHQCIHAFQMFEVIKYLLL